MSETVLASPRKSDLLEIVKTLSDVTRKLSEITRALAAQAGESPPAVEALAESEAALAQASRHLSMLQEEETHQQEREEARRKLRKDILVELSRRGRAFPLELAAAILTFVEDEPVLRELAQAFRHLSMLQEEETHRHEQEGTRRELRKDILVELSRRGRAFPLELAAAILTFVEDIEPVLRELEKEGLVRIRRVAGTEVIELTPMGRDAARRLNGL